MTGSGRQVMWLRRCWRWSLGLVWLLATAVAAAPGDLAPQIIRYVPTGRDDFRSNYHVMLLRAALAASEDVSGPWRLKPLQALAHQGRVLKLLEAGTIDVMWTMTSSEREQEALPIRIPLTAGLLGYRVLLIRQQEQSSYWRINTLGDLGNGFKGVQGHDWPDLPILRANGLKVVAEGDYLSMFRLVHNDIVDYFPRGLLEAWGEVNRYGRGTLAVDDHLLLTYPTAMYFFVRNGNYSLANRIETGLRRLIADGRFDDLLFAFPAHQQALANAQLDTRLRLQLANPLAPASLPLSENELWFSAERYQRWLAGRMAATVAAGAVGASAASDH